jgi:hypothetical protein
VVSTRKLAAKGKALVYSPQGFLGPRPVAAAFDHATQLATGDDDDSGFEF